MAVFFKSQVPVSSASSYHHHKVCLFIFKLPVLPTAWMYCSGPHSSRLAVGIWCSTAEWISCPANVNKTCFVPKSVFAIFGFVPRPFVLALFLFSRLHRANNVPRENISTPIDTIAIMCWSIFTVKNFSVSQACLTSKLDLSNLKMKFQHAKILYKITSFDKSFKCFLDIIISTQSCGLEV